MKKGIIRREQIIAAAEKLFYQQGYEATSVQDILDQLGLSKGGFYHHFESKLQLLEAICARHGAAGKERMEAEVAAHQGDAAAQLDALLSCCALWRPDNLDYAALLLNVAYFGGSHELRACVRSNTFSPAKELVRGVVRDGIRQGVFFTRYPDEIGELVLDLYANITDDIALGMVFPGPGGVDFGGIYARLDATRSAIETLLCAPMGTVTLCDRSDVAALEALYRQRRADQAQINP